MRANVPLSLLVAGKRNPRRVRPEREAHRRLVASIRAHGLLGPLVVRVLEGKLGKFQVIAGNRRLAVLREVHRESKDEPKIPCVVRNVDQQSARTLALAENFIREAMHPLDEAEEFAALAAEEGKGVEAIAAEFGVSQPYVRQRMKLATLADVVKVAYREAAIDTATAEAFASVPPERQVEVWKEVNGHPRHADHIRNVIAHAWIDAAHALFDVKSLPESAVSQDLFGGRVIVERQAFLRAQAEALLKERDSLLEDGWKEVAVGPRQTVQDRLYSMSLAEVEDDKETTRELSRIEKEREKVEAKAEKIDNGDTAAMRAYQEKLQVLEDEQERIESEAPHLYAEATKATGTAFLMLDPDGQVRREYCVPRNARHPSQNGNGVGTLGPLPPPPPPTSEKLSDDQLAVTFTHQALGVREALLKNPAARMRVLALILHEKVRSDALAIKREVNTTTGYVAKTEGFASEPLDGLRKKRAELDPFAKIHSLDECDAYARLGKLSEAKLDALIDLLIVETLSAHLWARTELVQLLASELGVDARRYWRPDAAWLAGYQKIQLAHLFGELFGHKCDLTSDKRKKTELVEALEKLFADAAEGKLPDPRMEERANRWLPANLREREGGKDSAALTASAGAQGAASKGVTEMDTEVLRLLAHIDQTRAEMRDILAAMPTADVVALVNTCARGQLSEIDEQICLLIGMLAVVAIFELRQPMSLDS